MKRLFTLWTFLLCLVGGVFAGETILKTVDFQEAGGLWLNAATDGVIADGTVVDGCKVSGALNFASDNTMNFGSSNMSESGKYSVAIPISGINGKITIKLWSTNSDTRVYYWVAEGEDAACAGRTATSKGQTTIEYTMTTIETSAVVYVGRQGSGTAPQISMIQISTPDGTAPEPLAKPKFYVDGELFESGSTVTGLKTGQPVTVTVEEGQYIYSNWSSSETKTKSDYYKEGGSKGQTSINTTTSQGGKRVLYAVAGDTDDASGNSSDLALLIFPDVTAADPVLPASTEFDGSYSVEITKGYKDDLVYYTTDGTDPTSESTLYEAPFYVDATTIVKAIAYDKNKANPSAVVEAIYTLKTATEEDVFKKVSSTADLTDGEYLIVYEDGNVAFNGNLETLDAAGNNVSVSIENDEIKASEDISKATFTIDTTDGTLLSHSGYYIGVTSNNNGLRQSDNTAFTNTFAIDETGNATILAAFEGSTMALRYNSNSDQMRFRYFKNNGGTQKVIALYKKVTEETPAELTEFYIMGTGTENEWSNTTAMTLNEETDAFEYDLTLTSTGYITFGDVAFTDWDDFNANHRYGIGEGDVNATLDTPTKLEKYNGCLVIAEAGKYKVTVTKDLVVTITKTGDVTITAEISRVQICGATDPEWSNRIDFDLTKGEGEEKVYTGVLDLTGSTNDVEFKLVVNEGTWIGFNELTLDAPEGWVEGPYGDGNNFMLKNSDTGYQTYTITATWEANADAAANWTLKIEGKDMAESELEVPGTVIWSNDEAQDVDWTQGKAVMIDAEQFADVKVGDRLNIGILGAPEDAKDGNWAYQVALQDGDKWKNLEGGETLKQAGDYVHSFIITGDMLRYMKQDGLAVNGTKFQVKKIAVESAYEGSDESIWVGEQTGNVAINICHFANAADFTGVKVGDIIRVTIDSPNWIGINYNTTDWKWSNFADDDFKVTNDYTNPVVEFTIKTDNAVNILNKENGGIFINNPNVTVTQVEIIPAPTYAVNIGEIENGTVTADKTGALEGETVTLTVTPENGYELESLTVKDADNGDVEVTDNTFMMPASDVTVTAKFVKSSMDVNITVENGKDIAAEVEAAAGGEAVRNLTITLEENGEYTLSAPLEAGGNIIINGAEGAIIDASGNSGAFIQMSATPMVEANSKSAYIIDNVTIKDVTIKGVKSSLFWDNKVKYGIAAFTIDNAVIELTTETLKNDAVISFQGGGIKDFSITNSTVYGNAVGNYFLRYNGNNGRIDNLGYDKNVDTQSWTYENNTFYKVLKSNGQWGNGPAGQSYFVYSVKNNIWYDSSKEIARRLLNGQLGGQSKVTFENNTYFNDGADVSDSQTNYDKSGTALTTDPGFADAAGGDFTLAFTSEQWAQKTGDPRWLDADPTVMVAPESGDFAAIVAQAVKEGKETLALPAGASYKAGSTVKVDKKLNIIGDENDPATLELGMKGFVIKDALDMENMIIDAATNEEPFIALSDEPNEELLGANNGSDYYNIMDPVILRNLTITGVKGKLFYDNNKKYALDNLLIENCIIQLRTPKDKKETVIYMQGGGIRMLEVNTSTIYQKGQGDNDYFVRYNNSARLDRMGYNKDMEAADFVPEGFIYESNTFYKVAYEGQWGNYSGFAGQKYTAFTVNKNIWVDCGSGQIARRMLGGRGASSYEVCEFDQNTYIYNGSAETEGTVKNGEPVGTYDLSGTAITKAPTFKLVATGDFTLDANDVQNKQQTGDPRWFAEEEATGIVNVNANVNDSQDAPAYNLAGQRVNANTAKGIIIKNGRKYVK